VGKFKKSTQNNVKFIDSKDLYDKLLDKNSIVVRIHDLVDFEHYKPILEPLYSDFGREAYDCIFMFKLTILQYLKNGLSDREVILQAKTNLEFKYFLDMAIDDPIPNYSKLSTFRERVGESNFKNLFESFVKILKDQKLITKDDIRYMDATHQLADVSLVSINTLLLQSCKNTIKTLEKYEKFRKLSEFEKKDFLLSEKEKKERFVKLVELARELQTIITNKYFHDKELMEEKAILSRILKERSTEKDGKVERQNNDDVGKLASLTDKDATWGSKSKEFQFLGYKHNVTAVENGFIEVVSTHKGHKGDEEFYMEDAKKISCNKIVTDSKYGTIKNRKRSKEINIQLVSPCKKNMTAHLSDKDMDDAFIYNHSSQYKQEMKKRGSIIEGIFGVCKNMHSLARAKYRGISKVSVQALITAFVINLKDLARMINPAVALKK